MCAGESQARPGLQVPDPYQQQRCMLACCCWWLCSCHAGVHGSLSLSLHSHALRRTPAYIIDAWIAACVRALWRGGHYYLLTAPYAHARNMGERERGSSRAGEMLDLLTNFEPVGYTSLRSLRLTDQCTTTTLSEAQQRSTAYVTHHACMHAEFGSCVARKRIAFGLHI